MPVIYLAVDLPRAPFGRNTGTASTTLVLRAANVPDGCLAICEHIRDTVARQGMSLIEGLSVRYLVGRGEHSEYPITAIVPEGAFGVRRVIAEVARIEVLPKERLRLHLDSRFVPKIDLET